MRELNRDNVPVAEHPARLLQFGEGNFLRAFVDPMIDEANEKGVTDTSVTVVSPRFRLNDTIQALERQEGLYHVCLEGMENGEPKRDIRLVKSVAEAFSPLEAPERYIRVIESPELRFIVSNTTEAGIRYEPDDAESLFASTFPGKITALLHHRWRRFEGDLSKGLIFLCCELIEDNGSTLREIVLRHAREAGMEAGFLKWVKDACIFCDTLVDRIVSGFPYDSIDEINSATGFDDRLVVKGEMYHVWAIGGDRAEEVRKELPLDKAGLNVLFMPDIRGFRDRKVRILNGCHTGMVPVALQLGCVTVLDAFTDRRVERFIRRMVDTEVLPAIEGDKEEIRGFADGILERFLNPYIRHMLSSIALNSLSKWETRNFPTVKSLMEREGRMAEAELFTFAALLTLYAPDSGFTPEDNPGHLRKIREAWGSLVASDSPDYGDMVARIVGSGIFRQDFGSIVPGFNEGVARYVALIREKGMAEALSLFLTNN